MRDLNDPVIAMSLWAHIISDIPKSEDAVEVNSVNGRTLCSHSNIPVLTTYKGYSTIFVGVYEIEEEYV